MLIILYCLKLKLFQFQTVIPSILTVLFGLRLQFLLSEYAWSFSSTRYLLKSRKNAEVEFRNPWAVFRIPMPRIPDFPRFRDPDFVTRCNEQYRILVRNASMCPVCLLIVKWNIQSHCLISLFNWNSPIDFRNFTISLLIRVTQRQCLENICSEHDLRSRIFGKFVLKLIACLPFLGFSNI